MLTGTPLDLTSFGSLLTAIGWLYWLLAALGLWWALRGERPRKAKLLRALPIVLIFGVGPGLLAWQSLRSKLKLDAAMALFAERCKTAGERITRTVDNVDGIVWMKWREEYSNRDNFADQWKLNDPYGRDCGMEDCIAGLLRVTGGATLNPEEAKRHAHGYAFVETANPQGERYRYTAHLAHGWTQAQVDQHRKDTGAEVPSFSHRFKLQKTRVNEFSARFGVTWDDVSTQEDREHWIAGGSLKVIDLHSNEVIAGRVGYMIDRGQGSQAGNRSPWLFAVQNACPEFPHEPNDSRRGRTRNETLNFVGKVAKPSRGDGA